MCSTNFFLVILMTWWTCLLPRVRIQWTAPSLLAMTSPWSWRTQKKPSMMSSHPQKRQDLCHLLSSRLEWSFVCHLLFESESLSLSLSLTLFLSPSSSQLGLSSRSDSNNGSADSVTTPTGGPATPSTTALASTDEPIHIINVAIKNDSSSSDEELVKKCYTFVQVHGLIYDSY